MVQFPCITKAEGGQSTRHFHYLDIFASQDIQLTIFTSVISMNVQVYCIQFTSATTTCECSSLLYTVHERDYYVWMSKVTVYSSRAWLLRVNVQGYCIQFTSVITTCECSSLLYTVHERDYYVWMSKFTVYSSRAWLLRVNVQVYSTYSFMTIFSLIQEKSKQPFISLFYYFNFIKLFQCKYFDRILVYNNESRSFYLDYMFRTCALLHFWRSTLNSVTGHIY